MPAWTNPPPTTTAAGVLRPERLAEFTTLERFDCAPELRHWVENYWRLTWSLPPGLSYPSHLVPHPACTLSIERGDTRPEVGTDPVVVTGVPTRRFDVDLRGSGWVLAAKFRPGGFAALTGVDASGLTDRVRALIDVLPDPAGRGLARRLAQLETGVEQSDCEAMVGRFDTALGRAAVRVDADPRYDLVLRIVAELLADRELVRVAQVAARFDIPERTLQRLFLRYVGVPPKWLISRYRLHDAITSIDGGYAGSLAELAASLGWYDQAHFNREFVALTGTSPGDYRSRDR